MEKTLLTIQEYAERAHGDQKRKYSGDPYIVHPIRVMKLTQKYTKELPALAAALLHDVLEDTAVTEKDLEGFLSEIMSKDDALKTLQLVVDLTDVYVKDSFPKLNRNVRKNKEAERLSKIDPLAQTVKYADLIDNSVDIAKNDLDFATVFLQECKGLLQKMDKGNPELYKKAVQVVNECLNEIKNH
ncbi:MAG: HD domain-containing protein [Cytophagaceae bacterium]